MIFLYNRSYNFYDLIIVSIRTDSRKYVEYFDREYGRIPKFSTSHGSCPKLNINLVKKIPKKRNDDIYKKVRFKRLFNYEYLIRNIRSNAVEVYFKRHFIDRVYILAATAFLYQYVILPIKFFILINRGILFLHAAGLSFNNTGFIFPAKSGAGKTTLSINLAKRGFKLLSDDTLIVDVKNQMVMGCSKPMCIFGHNINDINYTDGFKLKTNVRAKKILRLLLKLITRVEFRLHTKVLPEEIIPDIKYSEPVIYRAVMFLKEQESNCLINLKSENDMNRLATDIINASFVPAQNVIDDDVDGLTPTAAHDKRLYSYILFEKPELIEEVKRKEVNLVIKLISKLSHAKYINPRKMDNPELDCLAEELRDV